MELLEKWKNKEATDNQIAYIICLCIELKIPYIHPENLIKATEIIKKLLKQRRINEEQISYIKKYISEDELLGKTSYSDLTSEDLDKLFVLNANLNFNRIISNYVPKKIEIPEIYTPDYEIGTTISKHCPDNRMKYIKFYDMMVLDYDIQDLNIIEELLSQFNFRYRIYKTYNGYHVFIISHKISYNNEMMITIAKQLQIDPWYVIYCKYYGYVIRTVPKINRVEKTTHAFIKEMGTGDNIFPVLISLFDKTIHST